MSVDYDWDDNADESNSSDAWDDDDEWDEAESYDEDDGTWMALTKPALLGLLSMLLLLCSS